MGRHSISVIEGSELVRVEAAIFETLQGFYSLNDQHEKNNFLADQPDIGLLAAAPDDDGTMYFFLYADHREMRREFQELLRRHGIAAAFNSLDELSGHRIPTIKLSLIPGMKAEVLLELVHVRLAQLIYVASKGRSQFSKGVLTQREMGNLWSFGHMI